MSVHPSQIATSTGSAGQSLGATALGAIPIVGGVLDSIFGNRARARQQRLAEKRQHAYNMEMANFNFNKNLEMWQLQNAYNDPTQQMARLRKAGINPHMAYAKGSIPNVSGAPPAMEGQPAQAGVHGMQFPFGSTMRAYSQSRLQARQEDYLEAQTDNIKARTLTEGVTTGIKELDKIMKQFKASNQGELYKQAFEAKAQLIEKTKAEISNLGKSGKLIDQQAFNAMQDGLLKMDDRQLKRLQIAMNRVELDFAQKEGYPFSKADPTTTLILWAIEEIGILPAMKQVVKDIRQIRTAPKMSTKQKQNLIKDAMRRAFKML